MNERKSFQAKCNINEKNIFNNNINRKNKKQTGITLIALVISIIVMLILAGVSLNATIGDNGIITQAQNATYMQSIAVLEEFMQQQYVENYDTMNQYENKLDGFITNSELRNYFQKPLGDSYYFLDTENYREYYLIEKSALPEEIRNQIKGGDASNSGQGIYTSFIDVYGITSDLQVYFCSNGRGTRIGAIDDAKVSDWSSKVVIDASDRWSSVLGYNRDVTLGDLKSQAEINITENGLDLTKLAFFGSLKKITFTNVVYNDLDGIGGVPNLEHIFFNNSKIENYKGMEDCRNLKRLYLYFPPQMDESTANEQIRKLCDENVGIANADLKNLEYFGIFGVDEFSSREPDFSNINFNAYTSNITDITPIKNLNAKKYIKYLYLNNNKISDMTSLSGFENLYLLLIANNRMLNHLDGLQNLQKLTYIYAQNCSLYDTIGLYNCTSLYYLKLSNNSELTTLNDLEKSENLVYIYADGCSLGKYENKDNNSDTDALKCLENLKKVMYLDLKNNDLKRIAYLANLNSITYLYLEGNENINEDQVISIKNIIYNCGINYSISSRYSLLLDDNITNLSLKDQSIKAETFKLSLESKKKLEKLDLTGLKLLDSSGNELSSQETNDLINEVLSTLTSVKFLNLENVPKLNAITFVKNMPDLVEIVLYGTNVITGSVDENGDNNGLELLNNNLKLESLALDNENIELIKIVETLKRIKNEYIYAPNRFLGIGGLYAKNSKMFESLNEPNIGLETLGIKCLETDSVIDLSKCDSLKSVILIYGTEHKVKLPDSVELIHLDGQYLYGEYPKNLKRCTYINRGLDEDVIKNLARNCPNLESIATGNSNRSVTNLDAFTNACFKDSLKNLNLTSNERNDSINNIKGISGYSKLETLKIDRANISDLSGIETLTNLKELNLLQSSVSSLEILKDNVNINKIILPSNRVVSLHGLENLKKLTYLDLQNNCLQEIIQYTDENNELKVMKNLSIVRNLNKNNNGKLSTLLLAGNSNLTNFEEVENLSWNEKNGF